MLSGLKKSTMWFHRYINVKITTRRIYSFYKFFSKIYFFFYSVVFSWLHHAWSTITGRRGYLAIGSCIGVYLTVYSIIMSFHERQLHQATVEKEIFFNLVGSNESANFTFALTQFSRIGHIDVLKEPNIFYPHQWLEFHYPNLQSLVSWIVGVTSHCKATKCGSENGSFRANFARSDFSHIHLKDYYRIRSNVKANIGVDFSSTNLTKANFFDTLAKRVIFANAKLDYAVLSRSNFEAGDFTGASLQRAELIEAKLGAYDVDDNFSISSKFVKADMRGVSARCADFTGSEMSNVKFGPPVHQSDLIFGGGEADLRGVNFRYADLRNADFRGARIQSATFEQANLEGANFQGAIFDKLTILPKIIDRASMIFSDGQRTHDTGPCRTNQ